MAWPVQPKAAGSVDNVPVQFFGGFLEVCALASKVLPLVSLVHCRISGPGAAMC